VAGVTRHELIAALQAATGPAYVLDEAIDEYAVTLGLPPRVVPPPYTASIDAALTLVPEGWRWSLDWTQRPPYQDCGRADLYAPGGGIKPPDVQDVYAATPAIALCIAALRARARA
jgi:hypothetical protein